MISLPDPFSLPASSQETVARRSLVVLLVEEPSLPTYILLITSDSRILVKSSGAHINHGLSLHTAEIARPIPLIIFVG
jgi:hypothetical protein